VSAFRRVRSTNVSISPAALFQAGRTRPAIGAIQVAERRLLNVTSVPEITPGARVAFWWKRDRLGWLATSLACRSCAVGLAIAEREALGGGVEVGEDWQTEMGLHDVEYSPDVSWWTDDGERFAPVAHQA
jgi:hypothetical protein